MAKNTSSSAFRKIDIDDIEDTFKEDDANELSSPPAGPDELEIAALLTQGRLSDALFNVLNSAPLTTKNQQLKDMAFSVTLRVLMAIRAPQMDELIANLQSEQRDVLMKYVYRGFELPSEGSSGHLLVWHEKLFAVAGVGSIVRVLSDSKRV